LKANGLKYQSGDRGFHVSHLSRPEKTLFGRPSSLYQQHQPEFLPACLLLKGRRRGMHKSVDLWSPKPTRHRSHCNGYDDMRTPFDSPPKTACCRWHSLSPGRGTLFEMTHAVTGNALVDDQHDSVLVEWASLSSRPAHTPRRNEHKTSPTFRSLLLIERIERHILAGAQIESSSMQYCKTHK